MADTLLVVDVLTDLSHRDGERLRASFCEHIAELESLIAARGGQACESCMPTLILKPRYSAFDQTRT